MSSLQFGVGTELLDIQQEVCNGKLEPCGDVGEVPETIPPVRLDPLRTGTSEHLNTSNAGDEKDDRTACSKQERPCLSEHRQGSEEYCEEETERDVLLLHQHAHRKHQHPLHEKKEPVPHPSFIMAMAMIDPLVAFIVLSAKSGWDNVIDFEQITSAKVESPSWALSLFPKIARLCSAGKKPQKKPDVIQLPLHGIGEMIESFTGVFASS